ncbi:MAG: WD40 repeat domain-containing protein, partial [Opitutus sp.]
RLRSEFRLGQPVVPGGWEFPRGNDAVFAARFTDNTLGAFDAESGRPRSSPRALDHLVWHDSEYLSLGHAAGMSPDGRWLYALAHFRFWVWDATTGIALLQPEFGANQSIGGCDFTPDGTQIAVTVGGMIRRWTLPGGHPVAAPIETGIRPVVTTLPIRFAPDGRRIAVSVPDAGIWLLDASTGETIHRLLAPGVYINTPSIAFASDTRLFGAGSHASGTWDLSTGQFKPLPVGLSADVTSTSFDAAGRRVLSTGADGFVRLCDLVTGELVAEPAWRQHGVFCAALAPDGEHVVIGTASGTVQRLQVGRAAAQPLVLPREISPRIPSPFLAELPSRLLWLKWDRARVIDVASGREVSGGFRYPAPLNRELWGYTDWDSSVRADSRFMVMRTAQGWQAWERGPEGVIRVKGLEDSKGAEGPVRFSPTGELVALRVINPGASSRLSIWNLHTGALAGPIITLPSDLSSLTPNFSPDGTRIALGTEDGACMVLDIATARPVLTFATRPLVPNVAVSFSPDGARVLTSNSRNETRIWNAVTGKAISPMLNSEYFWGGARYLPNGRWFATWGVHSTTLWDGETGARVGETIPAGGRMVRFTRDSRSLGTADDSGIAQVWDVPSGAPFTEPMVVVRNDAGRLGNPEFSPDGRFLRTSRAKEIYIWSVPPRLPEGEAVPEWLLRLATVIATKVVNEAGELVDLPDAIQEFHRVQRQVAALPAIAPLADWGRWILDTRPERSIAPGFAVTKAGMEELAALLAADLAAKP